MFKKYLLFLFAASFSNAAFSQCTPDPQYANGPAGVWPDRETNLSCAFAEVSTGYETVVNIKTMTDTTVSISGVGSATGYIKALRIYSVTGLPAGFSYQANEPAWNNGGAAPNFTPVQGCVSLTASQASVQALLQDNPNGVDFNIVVRIDAYIDSVSPSNTITNFLKKQWLSDVNSFGIEPIPIEGYQIRIRPGSSGPCFSLTAGVDDIFPNEHLRVSGNFPNPFSRSTDIRFSAYNSTLIDFEVYNMVGKRVISKKIEAVRGENVLTVQADRLVPGIYMYTLSDGTKTVTRRMIVSAATH